MLRFAGGDAAVTMKVAISYTSTRAAWANLKAEADAAGFDAVRAAARDEWNALLGRIDVTGDPARRARFYTDLYFALLGRHTVSDAAGTYVDNTGAAQTLEHAYNDGCLARLAEHLGKADDAATFTARSKNYANLFDRTTGHRRPRNRDGSWVEPYGPWDRTGWTEAGGWNYTFYAAHDVPGLAECLGGGDALLARLEETFVLAEQRGFRAPHGEHEKSPLDYGNEPALFVAHLFHAAGRPDRTDAWLRKIYNALKGGNAPTDGYGGDEDQGMMGA